MAENIKNWVNVCVVKNNKILLLNRQHDDFPGWIPPGGKVEFPESFFEAAIREWSNCFKFKIKRYFWIYQYYW